MKENLENDFYSLIKNFNKIRKGIFAFPATQLCVARSPILQKLSK